MPILQHQPWDEKTYNAGANRDWEKEFVGAGKAGEYIDACNARPTELDGDEVALEKLKGEEIKYGNVNNACGVNAQIFSVLAGQPLVGDYACIGTLEVNNHIIEIWAAAEGATPNFSAAPSLIRIDGLIVLASPLFKFTKDHPLQVEKDESCIGGEIFLTDYNIPPFIFNVEDLLTNSNVGTDAECTEKYFALFDPKKYQFNLETPADHPIFVETVVVGSPGVNNIADQTVTLGAAGLPVGKYQYSIRLVTTSGDFTQLSIATPLIPVSAVESSQSAQYPYVRTRGADANTSVSSGYGIKIRFRVTNLEDFDFIEVARVSYNTASGYGYSPITEIIGKVDIANQQMSIIDVIDLNPDERTPVPASEITDTIAIIKRAKALRYFSRRLTFMNVEYESRDIEDVVTFDIFGNGDEIVPTIENVGTAGFKDPYNHAYYRPYMHGERYGVGAVFLDGKGQKTFGVPVANSSNIKMPERRDFPSVESLSTISNGTFFNQSVLATTVTNNTGQFTFEIFDLVPAVFKDDLCSWANILCASNFLGINAGKFALVVTPLLEPGIRYYCNSLGGLTPDATTNILEASTIGFRPFSPVNQNDSNVAGHNFVINTAVKPNSSPISWKTYTDDAYHPRAFGPRYFSLGMALRGIGNIPDWVQAFTIVRTEPAGRVIAQGLGFYALNSGDFNIVGNASLGTKEKQTLWFYSPDTDGAFGFVPQSTIDDINNNPANYQAQLVSPLGFFSELYSGREANLTGRDTHIDLMVYARILREDGQINLGDTPTAVGNNVGSGGYMTFGKFRNSSPPSFPADYKYNFNAANAFVEVTEGRGNYFKMNLATNVYNTNSTSGEKHFDQYNRREWTEPMYMINIIKDAVSVPQQNIEEYVETGHYQKINSIIGRSTGIGTQTYYLVDERWEDCVPDSNDPNVANIDRTLQIELITGITELWLNITFKTPAQLAVLIPQIQGGTSIYQGVYYSTDVFANRRLFKITFQLTSSDPTISIPDQNALIRVLYQRSVPIRFFGGDVTYGEAIFSPLDRQVDNGGGDNPGGGSIGTPPGSFVLNGGFPYYGYEINPRYYQVRQTGGFFAPNKIQDRGRLQLDFVRQMCATFTVESRIDTTHFFDHVNSNEHFSLKNYVIRPLEWKTNDDLSTQQVCDSTNEYGDTYPDEIDVSSRIPNGLWQYGGFRFLPSENIDYSQNSNTQKHFSKPAVGFKDDVLFCTRAIWSLTRPINITNSPSVRTFLSQNFFDVSDDQGEIKYAFDALSDKGPNLYAVCDSGLAMLITDKKILSDLNATQLAIIGTDQEQFILEEFWLSKNIGMNDETWRSWAEFDNVLYFTNHMSAYKLENNAVIDIGRMKYHSVLYSNVIKDMNPSYVDHFTGIYDQYHNEYWITYRKPPQDVPSVDFGSEIIFQSSNADAIHLVVNNGDSIMLQSGDTEDSPQVVLNSPTTPVYPGFNSAIFTADTFTICVDPVNPAAITIFFWNNTQLIQLATINPCECYLFTRADDGVSFQFERVESECEKAKRCNTYMFSEAVEPPHWLGKNDFFFDKYLAHNNLLYAMRNLETYELHKGYIMNNAPVEFSVIQASAAQQFKSKEFIRIRIASDVVPTAVEFYDIPDGTLLAEMNVATQGVFYLKDYGAFEQYIPRQQVAPFNRFQGRNLIFKIIHNLPAHFKMMDTGVQYKLLK